MEIWVGLILKQQRSVQTRVVLTSAAFVHLKQADFSKYTRNLSPASRTILLSGPAELYQQMLAKALAHFFEAKLLLLDVTDFALRIQSKFGIVSKDLSMKRSISETTLERMSGLLGSFSMLSQWEEPIRGSLHRQSSSMDMRLRGTEGASCVPKLRRNASADISSLASQRTYSNPVHLKRSGSWAFDEKLLIQSLYKESGKEDVAAATKSSTRADVPGPDNKNELENSAPEVKSDGAVIAPPPKVPEVAPDNEFEKRIRPEVIPANEIGVTFEDIGALDDIKESLQELVMLPLRRPDLFKGGLLKPCKGILLFGPPGTGKTMLAKAIANEAGASFINASMSAITSKWFGEDEKNVRALFTLAAKISPTIIFVDEVDSMLGQRTRVGEHEAMRKIKNEFMTQWDGLLTKPEERILVLAATNRPFDLDEAIIRRFERRIMVGLPSPENRELILKTLLAKEKVGGLDYKELAMLTEGYSGSDLKNLCTTAAYRPVRELIQRERIKEVEKKRISESGERPAETSETIEVVKPTITLRPLNMEDMKLAKSQVAASFASEGSIMNELKQWNDLYGEGGSRKKQQLSYFL